MNENVFDEALVSTNSASSVASVLSMSPSGLSIEYPPHKGKTLTAAHAEKKGDASVKLRSENLVKNLVTNLKNYPTVDCGVARCKKVGAPAVPKGGLLILAGCVYLS
jgi:hypothetical protein